MFPEIRYKLSADESRQQKAMLLLEHKEAVDALAELKERAIRIGRDIQQFGKWLADEPARRVYQRNQEQYGLPVDLLEQRYAQALNLEEALALADAIRAAMAKIKDLEDRKRNLGL